MKNLKLFFAFLTLLIFFLPANVNAQGQKNKTTYESSFYSNCFGEWVSVVVDFNEFSNNKTYHYNVLKAVAIGESSGYKYNMIEVFNSRDDDWNKTHNFRLIGPKGGKGFYHLVANWNKYVGYGGCF